MILVYNIMSREFLSFQIAFKNELNIYIKTFLEIRIKM